jgi:hypothetical protein
MTRHRPLSGAAPSTPQPEAGSAETAPIPVAVERARRPGKVIRDSFTMPASDYERIAVLKKRCIGLGVAIKKSELLRAGLATLERLSDGALAQVIAAVESVKTGRPAGKRKAKKKKKKGTKKRAKRLHRTVKGTR